MLCCVMCVYSLYYLKAVLDQEVVLTTGSSSLGVILQ